jgi:hypothetical protein
MKKSKFSEEQIAFAFNPDAPYGAPDNFSVRLR